MNHHARQLGPFTFEVWIEDGPHIVCEAKVLDGPDGFFIETIDTPIQFRRRGYARALVQKLQTVARSMGKECEPIMVSNNATARGFWASMGMKDALVGEHDGH